MTDKNPIVSRAGKIAMVCPNCYKEVLKNPQAVLKDKKIFRCVNGCVCRLVIRRKYDALPVEGAA